MNKSRIVAHTAILLLIAGCASTPQDTLSTEPLHLTGKLPPEKYARCIITNAENISGSFSGSEELNTALGARKVVIRHSSAGASVIANITPRDGGSDIVLWVSRNQIFRDTLVDLMIKGC